ncbi:PH domain-containing protein [Streptomyces sp. NPDC003374]
MPVRTTTADVVTIRTEHTRALWLLVALGTAGAALAVLRLLRGGGLLDVWLLAGLLLASLGLTALYWVTATVCGDAHGLRRRTLLRRRGVAWSDIADLRVQRHHGHRGTTLRVAVVLRDGRVRLLPLPYASTHDEEDFDRRTAALRALLHQYGTPASDHLAVVSHRTAGYGGPVRPLALAALLLACAAAAAWFVPGVAADERAWRSAAPCPAGTSAAQPRDADREPPARDCLSTAPAVIERIDVNGPKQRSVLHFAGHPLETAGVPRDAALEYRPGDEVRLTVWRGRVMRIAGEHHVWQEHVSTARAQAAVAAGLVLAAGWPGAVALLRLRARRLPADEVLPSALPFAGVLAGTALWLLPLCYLHPTSPLGSPTTISWAAAGSLATLALLAGAWHATRVRAPRGPATPRDPGSDRPENAENAEGPEGPEGPATGQPETEAEAFLPARFLEHTDYNPHGFGTHIVLGGGEPAVTPHAGPGRFAARRIPAQRLSLERIRRPRGDDGDTVPRGWHVAELDDAGTPVRLAAAPSDLTRILRALGCADPAAPAAGRTTTRDGERHPRNP